MMCFIVLKPYCFFQGDLNGHRGLVPSNFLQAFPDDAQAEPVCPQPAPEPKKESQVASPFCLFNMHVCIWTSWPAFCSTMCHFLTIRWHQRDLFVFIFSPFKSAWLLLFLFSLIVSCCIFSSFPAWTFTEAKAICTLWDLIVSVS